MNASLNASGWEAMRLSMLAACSKSASRTAGDDVPESMQLLSSSSASVAPEEAAAAAALISAFEQMREPLPRGMLRVPPCGAHHSAAAPAQQPHDTPPSAHSALSASLEAGAAAEDEPTLRLAAAELHVR